MIPETSLHAQDLTHYKKIVKELSSAKYQGRGYAYGDHVRRLAGAVVVGQEVVPIMEAHAAGEDGQCGETGSVVTFHVPPDAFEGGHAKRLLATLLDHAREELEIRRGLHFARDGFLHQFAKSQYVSIVRLHRHKNDVQKYKILQDGTEPNWS